MTPDLWIVAKNVNDDHGKLLDVEFRGVFDSEEKAVAACTEWEWWVGPCVLNQDLGTEVRPAWPGKYYPLARAYKADHPEWEHNP
jgi:hypothetical protein